MLSNSEIYAKMQFYALFLLESFLNNTYNSIMLILSEELRECINDGIYAYSSVKATRRNEFCECEFLHSLNIDCIQTFHGIKEYFKTNTQEFFDWLNQFLFENGLYFPYAKNLFFTLLICGVGTHINLLGITNCYEIVKIVIDRLKNANVNAQQVIMGNKFNISCNENCMPNKSIESDCCPCICCESYD